MRMLIHILLWSLCVQAVRADDWFWVNSKINGKPARLVLDTGCEPGLALFRHSAERLKLRATEIHSTNQIPYWLSDECTVKLPWSFWGFAHAKGQLTVVELPPYVEHSLNMDGVDGAPCRFGRRVAGRIGRVACAAPLIDTFFHGETAHDGYPSSLRTVFFAFW